MSTPGTLKEWEAVAEQVMKGKFAGATKSTVDVLLIGLRWTASNGHMRSKQAVIKLEEAGQEPQIDAPPKTVKATKAQTVKPAAPSTGRLF